MRKGKAVHVVLNKFVNDSRVYKEALSLCQEGYNVTVLGLLDVDCSLPVFETQRCFDVMRIKLMSRSLPKARIYQIIKYFEYFIRASLFVRRLEADVFHCHDLDTLPVGVLSRRIVVYDSHEFHRGRSGLNNLGRFLAGCVENFLTRWVDAVITVNEAVGSRLRDILGKEPVVLLNAQRKSEFCTGDVSKEGVDLREMLLLPKNTKLVIYAGRFSQGRGLVKLIDSVVYLHQNVAVILIGYGPLKNVLEKVVTKRGLSNRVFGSLAVCFGVSL